MLAYHQIDVQMFTQALVVYIIDNRDMSRTGRGGGGRTEM